MFICTLLPILLSLNAFATAVVNETKILLQVFEDENEAVKYCDLLQGGGKGCEGVVEIEASSVSIRANVLIDPIKSGFSNGFPNFACRYLIFVRK